MAIEGEENLKQQPKEGGKKTRSFWSGDGQVFFTDGYGWGLHLVDVPSGDGRGRYEVKHISLGKEEDVLAVLNGAPITDALAPVQREVLARIVGNREEGSKNGRDEAAIRAPRLLRTGFIRTLRSRQKGIRRLKAGERLSFRQT